MLVALTIGKTQEMCIGMLTVNDRKEIVNKGERNQHDLLHRGHPLWTQLGVKVR